MAGDARPSFDHQDIFQGNEQLFLTVLLFDLECNSRTYEPRCFESLLGLVRFKCLSNLNIWLLFGPLVYALLFHLRVMI